MTRRVPTTRPFPHERPLVARHRLEVFVPVHLVNALNRRDGWAVSARRARTQRDAVAAVVLATLGRARFSVPPSRPKAITFDVYVGRAFDSDGCQAAVKHVRDGLIDAGVIADDGPATGHVFTYAQHPRTPRAARGVRITVTLA